MQNELKRLLNKAAKNNVDLSLSEKTEFGHYSTNAALRLAKERGVPPRQTAEEIIKKIQRAAPAGFLDRMEIAGQGFINFWLTPAAHRQALVDLKKKKLDSAFARGYGGQGKTVIVEYSQPNIAKRMHVGHLRSTIIGDALANAHAALGYKVIRWNYLGDWGTQFGKLIAAYKLWGDAQKVRKNPIEELNALYVKFHAEIKKRPELEDLGRREFKNLEDGDKENRRLWQWFRAESLKSFNRTYKRLGVKFDLYLGESFFERDMRPLTAEFLKKSIAKKSQGAIVVPLDKFGLPPALIQKADGASLYLTRDIANLRYRLQKYKPAKILYVVGNEQSLHFEQLFRMAEIMKFKGEFAHVKFGLVLGEEGKKLATREGRVILLDELLNKITGLAKNAVKAKARGLSAAQIKKVSECVGIGALKYNDLRENRNSDITFNWERMLDMTGDSAPYLQYTYARLKSILRKAPRSAGLQKKADLNNLETEIEFAIIRKILELPNEIQKTAETYFTNNIALYLYNLAVLANRFYESAPILKDPLISRRRARLILIETIAETLKKGLAILGIEAPDKI